MKDIKAEIKECFNTIVEQKNRNDEYNTFMRRFFDVDHMTKVGEVKIYSIFNNNSISEKYVDLILWYFFDDVENDIFHQYDVYVKIFTKHIDFKKGDYEKIIFPLIARMFIELYDDIEEELDDVNYSLNSLPMVDITLIEYILNNTLEKYENLFTLGQLKRLHELNDSLQENLNLQNKKFDLRKKLEESDGAYSGVNEELQIAHKKIIEIRNQKRIIQERQKQPSKCELQKVADETLKKNGKINYSRIAEHFGVCSHTSKNWCKIHKIKSYNF